MSLSGSTNYDVTDDIIMTSISHGWGISVKWKHGVAREAHQMLVLDCVRFKIIYAIKGLHL